MRFSKRLAVPALVSQFFLLSLMVCGPSSMADESQSNDSSQPIALASQNSNEGVCDQLILAGDDQTQACGTSLVVITMTNGSVSITLQHANSDLGLYGSELSQAVFNIHGAFVRGTENVPLQGRCEITTSIDNASSFLCDLTDEQGQPWKIQFTSQS